jgi:flagellar biosynthesis protein FlhG
MIQMDQAENLRTIIKKQNQRDISNARIIAVTSGKGGVGKSSVSINLALQFSRMGKKVIILDADFGLANIEVMFGIIPKSNLSDLVFKGKELNEILVDGPEGIRFISGGSGIAKLANLDREQIKGLVNKLSELEELADVVIIDTGAGMSPSVMEFLVAAPEVIVVATPEPTSITDSYALLKSMKMYQGYDPSNTRIRIVANKVMNYQEGEFLYEKLNMVVKQFLGMELEFLGIIPQDNSVSKAVMKQKPVTLMYPRSEAAQCIRTIAENLDSSQDPVFIRKNGMRAFLRNVFSRNY